MRLAWAGSYLELDWVGRVDWSSGYAVAYGHGVAPAYLTDHNLRRAAAQKAAFLEASRSLIRLCLDLRVQGKVTVRDYFREDSELQNIFREMVRKLPPWKVVFGRGDEVRLALRLPLGGPGSLSEVLGDLPEMVLTSLPPSSEEILEIPYSVGESPTGLVLLFSHQVVVPVLRPRILGPGGGVILDYRRSSAEARARPAYIAYYSNLERALEDPVLGDSPIVVTAAPAPGSSTDIVVPSNLESRLLHTPAGRELVSEARVVVVLTE